MPIARSIRRRRVSTVWESVNPFCRSSRAIRSPAAASPTVIAKIGSTVLVEENKCQLLKEVPNRGRPETQGYPVEIRGCSGTTERGKHSPRENVGVASDRHSEEEVAKTNGGIKEDRVNCAPRRSPFTTPAHLKSAFSSRWKSGQFQTQPIRLVDDVTTTS